MAKKEETISMIDTLAEFKELKNIDNYQPGKRGLRNLEKPYGCRR